MLTGFEINTNSEIQTPKPYTGISEKDQYYSLKKLEEKDVGIRLMDKLESMKDPISARRTRIQNIFLLCGNHRELSQHMGVPTLDKKIAEATDFQSYSSVSPNEDSVIGKENFPHQDLSKNIRAEDQSNDGTIEVYVKWEASKECPGKFLTRLKVLKDSSLADLRKLIEIDLRDTTSTRGFSFLMLGDPTGAPVTKEKEATIHASKLPICNNQPNIHFACLRPVKRTQQCTNLPFTTLENNTPFTSLENKLQFQNVASPKSGTALSPTPLISALVHR